jgi:hypothetical protein
MSNSFNAPVTPGAVWQAGPHRFYCGDALELWESGRWSDIFPVMDAVYTDPPWNAAIRHTFARLAQVPAPSEAFEDFLRRIVELLRGICPSGRLAVEMGLAHFSHLQSLLAEQGATMHGEGMATYGRPPRPSAAWFGSFKESATSRLAAGSLHGPALCEYALDFVASPLGGASARTFCDPFCGQLVFVRAAMKRDLICYGCELIPAKLARGLSLLSAYWEVERVQ